MTFPSGIRSVAPYAVGDAGQHIVGGGDRAAVAVASQIVFIVLLRARLVLMADEVEIGIEHERVGGGDAVMKEAERSHLSVESRLLISVEILVDGGGLVYCAVGIEEEPNIHEIGRASCRERV